MPPSDHPILRSALTLIAAVLLATAGPSRAPAAGEGQLVVTVVDEKTKKPIPCRMHLVGPHKKPRKVEGVPNWADHFVMPGKIALKLPVGNYTFEVERGPEYLNREGHFRIEPFADDTKQIELRRFVDLSAEGWWSGDLFVRRPVRDAELILAADDLHLAEIITWWNDKSDGTGRGTPKDPVVSFDENRCYDVLGGGFSRAGTEMLCLRAARPAPAEFANAEYPPLVKWLVDARKNPDFWADVPTSYSWDLPMLVALGQVDSIQVAHSRLCRKTILADDTSGRPRDKQRYPGPAGYARWCQEVYFRLLDCGLRIPPSAGSGSGMTPNPAGYDRAYVHIEGEFSYEKWWEHFRLGQVVVTNGPLLRPTVEGRLPGHVFQGQEGQDLELEIGLTVSATDPISYLDVIQDGKVLYSVRFDEYAKTGRLPKIQFKQSGWFLVRVVADTKETYRFGMTGPYYVEFGDKRRISKRAAQFFLDWVYERARQIQLDDPAQRGEVLQYHRKARDFWQDLVAKATAD